MSYFDPTIYCPHNIRSKRSKAYVMGMLHYVLDVEKSYKPLEYAKDFIEPEMGIYHGNILLDKTNMDAPDGPIFEPLFPPKS